MSLDLFIKKWEKYLNEDPEIPARIASPPWWKEAKPVSKLEGRDAVEITIDENSYTIEVKNYRFHIREGVAKTKPLLSLSMPISLFKNLVLGKRKVVTVLLDDECRVKFDTPDWNHYDGATVLEMLVAAQELVQRDSEAREAVEKL
jgi:hypothetical protein